MTDKGGVTHRGTTTIVTPTSESLIILDEDDGVPEFVETEPTILVIDKIGPRGPEGPQGQTGDRGEHGTVGDQGPQGPQGISGAGQGFRHIQSVPATQWDITHNLNAPMPGVQVMRSDGGIVHGRVVFGGSHHLSIYFSAAISGEAYLT